VIELISDPKRITLEWLTQVLSQCGSLSAGKVIAVEQQVIGTGKMGDNIRLSLRYDGDDRAPATLVAKLPAADETARGMASAMGAYRKEVMFYRDLAQLSDMSTPKIYLALIDDSGSDFIILMEDLAPAEPGSQLVGETIEHAKQALTEAAKLHAAFYDRADLLAKDFISRTDADGASFGQELMQQNWPGFIARFGHGLSEQCIAFGDQYVANHARWVVTYNGPKTLVHGDFRTENLMFSEGGRTTVVDWQTLMESCGMADVAYFIGGSMTTEDRRTCEQELVEYYRQCLRDAGVKLSFDACWQQYREFSMHGLMITVLGAMFSEAEVRSDQMFLTMAQRHLQHCIDMQAEAFF
jgi:hypothetical protein